MEAARNAREAAPRSPAALSAELSDARLVALCRGGDEEAWSTLVERFSRYVYAIAVQAFRLPQHDAEDVFQDVFARVFERLDTLREDEAVRPWIAQLTRRLCIDRLRAGSREVVADTEELPDGPDEDVLAQIEEAFDVHDALAGLPEHCREILDRFFARDESYRAIGEALELPAGTIASRISRCLDKLRDAFQARSG
jgi:RNA polymerase sigma-70 factor (ECF subfamily)